MAQQVEWQASVLFLEAVAVVATIGQQVCCMARIMHGLVELISLSSLNHWSRRDAPLHGTLIDLFALDEKPLPTRNQSCLGHQHYLLSFSRLFSCILHHFLQAVLNLGPLTSEPKGHN
jgi:hypothetical protein